MGEGSIAPAVPLPRHHWLRSASAASSSGM